MRTQKLRTPTPWTRALAIAGVAALTSCTGSLSGDDPGANKNKGPTQEVLSEIGVSGMRRLTAAEYDQTVYDLLGVEDIGSELVLPADPRSPFDNDYTSQEASEALISSVESLSGSTADSTVTSASLRESIMPCEPSGDADSACFRSFLEIFGRRALRRPLSEEEIDRYMVLLDHGEEAADFWIAVDSGLRMFLQHPEFLYRVEIGEAVPNDPDVFQLNDFEIATRAAYLILGSTPPDWLLDAAEAGELSDPAGMEEATRMLLEDDRARSRIARFHSMWLGYEILPHSPELSADLELETRTLLDKVIFEDQSPWINVLLSDETYLTDALAEHYGLPAPDGGEGWVSYGDTPRRGLLSQGSFLSAVAKFSATSPTQRGLLIRTRLFCQTINPPPPDLNVDVDNPPEAADPNACKAEKYSMWKTDGCKLCHAMMDPVGFGLENFDSAGRYREFEPDRPDCEITGEGTLEGVGDFSGPAELADLIVQSGDVDACVATQLYRFAAGRYELGEHDNRLLARLSATSAAEGLQLHQLIIDLTTNEAFRYRREEVAQ